MTTVWLKYPPHPWHAIRTSTPGLRIVFACLESIPYVDNAPTSTSPDPRCPACDRELRRQPAVRLHVDPVIEVTEEGEWNWQATEGGDP